MASSKMCAEKDSHGFERLLWDPEVFHFHGEMERIL